MTSQDVSAAIVTVGTELLCGLAVDTNSAEIALALTSSGFDVIEMVSVGDEVEAVADTLRRLTSTCRLVVVTGGLGPTHDDITREAAASALGRSMIRNEATVAALAVVSARHTDDRVREAVLAQADVLEGARVILAVAGTAPGQVAQTPAGELVLLPGPPREMRPMLAGLQAEWSGDSPPPAILRCTGIGEADAQLRTSDALRDLPGLALTVLAALGDVRIVLRDRGAGPEALAAAAARTAEALGEFCYSTDGSSLAETVLRLAREQRVTLASAESCTGGMISAALTDPAGASDVFMGGAVTYSNDSKVHITGVDPALISTFGAVSDAVAKAMAFGAHSYIGADLAVSATGVAGPTGGSADKPVGTVWFGLADENGAEACLRRFSGDRAAVRARATAFALDLLRRRLAGI